MSLASQYLANGLLRSVTPWSAREDQAVQDRALYTAAEISRMTDDALDELLSYYQDTGNGVGAEMVQDEITTRYDEREDAREAEQERQQIMHDEMLDSELGRGAGFGGQDITYG